MTKEITVQGLKFEVSTPFAEGHTCTEAEAKALNQVRAENIRNNMARKVKDATDTHGKNLPDEVVQSLHNQFAEYDQNYEFTLANVGGGSRTLDPVEREAQAIARSAIRTQAKKEGRRILKKDEEPTKEGDITKERFDELVAQVAARDNVIKAAKKAVAERDKAGEVDLAAV